MKYYLVAFQILVFIVYVGAIWRAYGILPSISSSWYKLEKLGALFTLFIWSLGFSTAILGGILSDPAFIASGGVLIFTGAAADYQREHVTKIVHYIGALFGILFAFMSIALSGAMPVIFSFVITSIVAMLFKEARKNGLWWLEINAIIHIESGILYLFLR
jgi:hypothetical protein